MLDVDETASYDEAMRHDPRLRQAQQEMDFLVAAVAVVTTLPIKPRAGQLERLHFQLGLHVSKPTNWLGISGWAAAAVLAMILVIHRSDTRGNGVATKLTPIPTISPLPSPITSLDQKETAMESENRSEQSPETDRSKLVPATSENENRNLVKIDTRRLIQEIEILHGELKNFQQQDRERFETAPGVAWPIVMRMEPPRATSANPNLPLKIDDSPITTVLVDALVATNQDARLAGIPLVVHGESKEVAPPSAEPSAIPIYDSARDNGTLVVSNLPLLEADEAYHLWVTSAEGGKPIYVGRLPKSNATGAESFDFCLGSARTVPAGFLLTKDTGEAVAPSSNNTILQGPR
jgi:hypothetical protein